MDMIIPNVISREELCEAEDSLGMANNNSRSRLLHNTIDPHGIYKYHEVGHQSTHGI